MKKIVHIFILLMLFQNMFSQHPDTMTIRLTVKDAIEIARKQSPDVLEARHSFRSSYWNYCYYKANYLPSLTFSSTPNFDHSINKLTMPDGSAQFVQQNQLVTDAGLSLSQNISFTGGTLSVNSSIQRLDLFGANNGSSYQTNPITIAYQQSLFGYNKLKWDSKIEPLRYDEAKKEYIETLELVAAKTTMKFFDFAKAQSDLNIARTNYANADTLYTFAKRRYNIGTINENEMLQLEVNRLNEESNMLNAQMEVDNFMKDLRFYLGIVDSSPIEAIIDVEVPQLIIDLDKALILSLTNSPDITNMQRRKQESQSNVAYAKSLAGLKADVFAQFGLTQTGEGIRTAYKNPLSQQYIQIGIRLPILDWGRGRGQIQVAKSNRDMVYTQVEQDKIDFELNVVKTVRQFNLQLYKVNVASRIDSQQAAATMWHASFICWANRLCLTSMLPSRKKTRRYAIT